MPNNKAYNSFIKDIWLELPDYKFKHDIIKESDRQEFVGRNEIQNRLYAYLDTESKSGAYLITGYRGMGKTSFVNRVIHRYEKEYKDKKIRRIEISFAQKNMQELDVLRQIVKGIRDSLFNKETLGRNHHMFFHKNVFSLKSLPVFISIIFCFILFSLYLFNSLKFDYETGLLRFIHSFFESGKTGRDFDFFISIILTSIFFAIPLWACVISLKRLIWEIATLYDRMDDLYERCQSENQVESGMQSSGDKFPFGLVSKQIRKFSIANPKEVENEIIEVLKILAKKKYRFVFVFDEIDKIDSNAYDDNYYEELGDFEKRKDHANVHDFRERKKAVTRMLSNLKYLITSAQAKFFFIAGREMFDASLADIADRQSSISSIFNQVLNVDSFLKDKNREQKNSSATKMRNNITGLIETYLSNLLLPKDEVSDKDFLTNYKIYLDKTANGLCKEAKQKVIYSLQSFIIYLTYRSNGSPKKLLRIIEELIKEKDTESLLESAAKVNSTKPNEAHEDLRNIYVYARIDESNDKIPRKFLYLNFSNQYKFGLINYMYRPLIASRGKYEKTYSDRLLVSTPYLIDHIVKFHPFAFSMQNLELMPEVLSETRIPELRNFIKDIVKNFQQSHVRETEIGLFEFKFIKKTTHELEYICKIFEEESAAFNFTLDETFPVKLHLRNKIKELRSIYKDFRDHEVGEHLRSISFLNEILGDSEFFDQEYDAAIVSYSDALQALLKQNKITSATAAYENFSIEHLIIYLRYRLKLALTYEKMNSHEIAMAVYIETNSFWKDFLLQKRDLLKRSRHDFYTQLTPSLTDLAQIVVQPLIAELYLIEKFTMEGVTLDKLNIAELNIEKFFQRTIVWHNLNPHHLIIGNYYSHVGSLIFFKNLSKGFISPTCNFCKKHTFNLSNFDKLTHAFSNYKDFKRKPNLSFSYYKKYLENLLCNIGHHKLKDKCIIELLIQCEKDLTPYLPPLNGPTIGNNAKRINKTQLKNTAIALSKIGDVLLSCVCKHKISITNAKINFQKNNSVFQRWSFAKFSINDFSNEDALPQFVQCIYYWSAYYYLKAGKNISASFQYRKILRVALEIYHTDTLNSFLPMAEEFFLHEILKISSWNTSDTSRFQIHKFNTNFEVTSLKHPLHIAKYNYVNTSNSSEIKEALFYIALLKIKATGELKHNGNDVEYKNLVSPYNTISTQFIRIGELNLQSRINLIKIKSLGINVLFEKWKVVYEDYRSAKDMSDFKDMIDDWQNYGNQKLHDYETELKKYDPKETPNKSQYLTEGLGYVASNIFNLNNIISIFNRQGISYFMNHLSLANYYRYLGDNLKLYEMYKFIKNEYRHLLDPNDDKADIEKLVSDLIGTEIKHMSALSNYQLALHHYNKAKAMHNEGGSYKSQIADMYYLEDDFSDILDHFSIAEERQKLNAGRYNVDIEALIGEVAKSQLFDAESYFNNY